MYPVTPRFLAEIPNPTAILTRVEVWRAGTRIDTFGDDGLPVYGGSISVDGAKQVRRMLTGARVDATDAMWDLLSPVGTRLHAFRGFRYLNRETELVPVGRFVLDELTETYGGDWDGQIGTAPDLMALVQRAKFPRPRAFAAGTFITTILRDLISEALGPVAMFATSGAQLLSPVVYERDRGKAIEDLATSIAADVYCAPDGTPTVADVRQLEAPSWSVMPGDGGTLFGGTRSRSLARTYSAVSAQQAGISGEPTFLPQVAYDSDPSSPTYYLGPFGEVTYFMSSDLFTTAEQAAAAAQARLPYVTAARAQLDVSAECNPALDAGDTINVTLPARSRNQQPVTERHLVGSLTVPLTPDGTSSITTRSAVADVDDSE